MVSSHRRIRDAWDNKKAVIDYINQVLEVKLNYSRPKILKSFKKNLILNFIDFQKS